MKTFITKATTDKFVDKTAAKCGHFQLGQKLTC